MDHNNNVLYLKLHSSPRSNSLPKALTINSRKIPLNVNLYSSFSRKIQKKLINFFRDIKNRSTLIVEYDGNFVPIFILFWTNIFYKKRFRVFLDCHVNAYLDTKSASFKTLAKRVILLIFKGILSAKIIVHNKKSLELFKDAFYCPSPFPEVNFSGNKKENLCDVFIISSLNKDEPIDEFAKVAEKLNAVGIKTIISGDLSKLKKKETYNQDLFSGYLDKDEFYEHIISSKIIIAMTIRKNNLLYAPREALQMKKVCLINGSEENKDFYKDLCLYSPPVADFIIQKIHETLKDNRFLATNKIERLIEDVNKEIYNFKRCIDT